MPRAEKYYPNASQVLSGSRKKHVCSTCERAFTTSGHLARHTRVHTGERNHKCPFPGCETRCSRQDNLQQHYRIHMSPGSRRNSARARKRAAAAGTLSSSSTTTTTEAAAPPSPPGRGSTQTPPPGSPPPLTHATLPATASLTLAPAARLIASSPDRHLISPHALTLTAPLNYSYRTAVNAYPYAASSFHGSFTTRNPSSISATSRLSISHLSNPHYPPSQPASTNPPSPASVSSQASPPSAPPTPSYHHVSYNDSHSYPHQLAHSHFHNQPHLTLQTSYASTRFNSSPPPTLAPIQDERYIRRQEPRILQQSHQSSPYIHHPQPLSDYSYHHSIALNHGAWKTDSIRKGVGPAAVI